MSRFNWDRVAVESRERRHGYEYENGCAPSRGESIDELSYHLRPSRSLRTARSAQPVRFCSCVPDMDAFYYCQPCRKNVEVRFVHSHVSAKHPHRTPVLVCRRCRGQRSPNTLTVVAAPRRGH